VRLAWFAPRTDDIALELARTHTVDQFDAARAHDFVWQHFRSPYDLTVFELADSPAHAYVWPYLVRYPGVVILRASSLQQSRTEALTLQQRRSHLRAERAFGGSSLLRAPLVASRLVVVHDEAMARAIRDEFPGVDVRVLPVGVTPPAITASLDRTRFRYLGPQPEVAQRAAARAREAGADVSITPGLADLRNGDVVIALEWPPTGAPSIDAVRAMAAGLPAIVLETEAVAGWPTLDPQTWQPRAYRNPGAPIAISIDPRDEEHSLMLCMRRFAADPALAAQLGSAARTWAHEHARAETVAMAWEHALEDTAARPPTRGTPLPAHLTADGSERVRALLAEVGADVDFLDS
jgi:hypothetical protein